MDMGLATSTPLVDHDPGAGWYEGTGRLGRVWTKRTLSILRGHAAKSEEMPPSHHRFNLGEDVGGCQVQQRTK
jgi:hypothetical protein